MRYLVRLESCADGSEPDDAWKAGAVVVDHRVGGSDLLRQMCKIVGGGEGSVPLPGEVYTVEPLTQVRRYVICSDGSAAFVEPL